MPPITRRFSASQYGIVDFEGAAIPCAFGGEPGHFTALVMIEGICQVIGVDFERELERIQAHHLLERGLYLVPYQFTEQGKHVIEDCPSITLTRLHTWLAEIPPASIADAAMRAKLTSMQDELTDLIYGYFGRPLLPSGMLAEDEKYLDDKSRQFYDLVQSARETKERIDQLEDAVGSLRGQVESISMTVNSYEEGEHIEKEQQERLRAMIDLLSRKYQEKHGQGTYDTVLQELKKRFDFRYYKAVKKETYPDLVRECVNIFRSLHPKGTPLPQVFKLALTDIEQSRLF